jgi:CheY-like chemotaxis protein
MPHKLLLADDSVTIQRVIELTFADEDIDVSVVGDGKHAIEHIMASRPDIVLADIGMPERDGYEVAAFVKGDPALAHIPVVLLTGAFEPLDETRARNVGCDGVLVKPFEPQMVINRVRELLSGQRPVAVAAVPAQAHAHTRAVEQFEEALAPPPAAAAERRTAGDSLEDYFDRLDAAFANVGAPPGAPPPPRLESEDLSSSLGELHQPPPQPTPAHEDPFTNWDPELSDEFGPAKQPHLANAFAALLAAEQGHVVPAPPQPAALSDAAIDAIVERVLARLNDDTLRRTVLETAERLVRQEIERIKLEAQAHRPGPHAAR